MTSSPCSHLTAGAREAGSRSIAASDLDYKLRDGKIVYVYEYCGPGRSPRSRRALGVGDVAGERGDRAAFFEAWTTRAT